MRRTRRVETEEQLRELREKVEEAKREKRWRLRKIATHHANLDSIVAVWLLRRFGAKLLPGAGEAGVIFWSAGEAPKGKSWQEWLEEGVLAVNVGLGPLDHHPHGDFPGECAASLVAKFLGIDDDPALGQILEYTARTDLRPEGNPGGLASRVKALAGELKDFERVYDAVQLFLESWLAEQKKFHLLAAQRYPQERQQLFFVDTARRRLTVVAGETENPDIFSRIARSKEYGDGADVVITKNNKGQVAITAKPGISLRDVARLVRTAENEVQGLAGVTDWKLLESVGKVAGMPQWYYFVPQGGGQALLNGSANAPDTPPTKLSLEKIAELVTLGLKAADGFPLEIEGVQCTGNPCIGQKCRLYPYGFVCCRRARYRARQSQ